MKSPDAETGIEILELQLKAENPARRSKPARGPLSRLRAFFKRLRRGGEDQAIGTHTGVAVDEIATAFNLPGAERTAGQLALELPAKTRLQNLERHARQLQAAATVGQAAVMMHNLDELIDRVTMLIREHFGYDQAAIFLVDAEQEPAMLGAGNGEGDLQMLAADQTQRAGETSLISMAARSRQPQIARYGGLDEAQFTDPYSPNPRAEIALPLVSGERLWGVLDLQSDQAGDFSDQDLDSLQILAGQVAIAIENARRFQENQETIQALRQTMETSRQPAGEPGRDGWQALRRARPVRGYVCKTRPAGAPQHSADPTGFTASAHPTDDEAGGDLLEPASGPWQADMIEASRSGETIQTDDHTLVIPIIIRKQVAGAVRLRKPETANAWTEQEIALMKTLSDQLSVAMESAQLYEDTRRRAERERLASEITAKVRASNDPQVILNTALNELQRALQASRAQVRLQSSAKPDERAPQAPQDAGEPGSGNDEQAENRHAEQSDMDAN